MLVQSNTEFLADAAYRDALGPAPRRRIEALDRLEQRLAAQLEGLMMNGNEALGAGVISHLPGLLRRAMKANPRIVRADGHDCEVHGPGGANGPKRGSDCRFAGTQNPYPPVINQISVIFYL